jgi:hypothetical protein
MGKDGSGARRPLVRVETVRGVPYHVGDRKLTPVARVTSLTKARGTIGSDRIGGWGVGFARATPLAVLEETGDFEQRIPIHDATARALWLMAGGAVAVVLFFSGIRWFVRRRRS